MIKILIAEDDERISVLHKSMADKVEGFEVVAITNTVADSKEYLSILKPDLVLLDVYFPDGNGLDVIEWIRSEHIKTDVILITAAKEMAAIEKSLRFGVFDYLVKPIMFARFEESLRRFIAHKTKLSDDKEVTQSDIDSIISKGASFRDKNQITLPKGIDSITFDKILERLREHGDYISSNDIAAGLGINRTTARRYLEYFTAIGLAEVDSHYGTVGRPERKYKAVK